MKKCPKCKAEIEENARFCLYCMTSFEEKEAVETPKESKKLWIYIIAAVLVLVLIVVGILLFAQKDTPNNEGNDTSTNSSISSDLDTPDNTTSSEQQNSDPQGNETSTPTSSNQTQTPSKNEGSTNNNSGNTTTTPSQTTTVAYIYRDAEYGDDFSVGANLENSVVITGVITASASGEYKIPDTLDGKKVVAIMSLAFCDESISNTVKKVIVPSTVKTIWNNAFANCYNLTDIYFCGNSIYTETNAFPETSTRSGKLTIHCSANCSDRNYRYYKNSASYYDAEYEEWNG